MSSILRDWIRLAVMNALGHPPEALEDNSNIDGKSAVIRFHLTKSRCVQLQEFQPGKKNLCIISDGFSKIRAEIDQAALDQFVKIQNRDLLGINGGIIQISNYHLIFNPNTKPTNQLKIEIHGFNLKGSEGSSAFGRPSDITDSGHVQEAMASLTKSIMSAGPRQNIQNTSVSNIHSRSREEPGEDIPAESLFAFATQAPPPAAAPSPKVHQQNLKSQHSNVLDKGNQLIGLLSTRVRKPAIPQSVRTTKGKVTEHVQSTPKKVVLAKNPTKQVLKTTDKLRAKANSQLSQLSPSSPSSRTDFVLEKPRIIQGLLRREGLPLSVNEGLEKENSQGGGNDADQPSLAPLSSQAKRISKGGEERLNQVIFIDRFQVDNPFTGMKRIPRRYVQISEHQRNILDGKGSWFEKGDNGSSLYANIPSGIQEELNKFVGQRLNTSTDQECTRSESEGDDQGDHEEEEAEEKDATKDGNESETANSDQRPPKTDFHDLTLLEDSEEDLVSWPPSSPIRDESLNRNDSILHEEVNWDNQLKTSQSYTAIDSTRKQIETPFGSPENAHSPMFSQPMNSQVLEFPSSAQEVGEPETKTTKLARQSFIFLPSSPGESEFEFEIPLAIGSQDVENNDRPDEALEKSQRLPSIPSTQLSSLPVQVKQTPQTKVSRITNPLHPARSIPTVLDEIEPFSRHHSSSPRIPATFNDANTKEHPPSSKETTSSNTNKSIDISLLVGEQNSSYPGISSVALQGLSGDASGLEKGHHVLSQQSPDHNDPPVETAIWASQEAIIPTRKLYPTLTNEHDDHDLVTPRLLPQVNSGQNQGTLGQSENSKSESSPGPADGPFKHGSEDWGHSTKRGFRSQRTSQPESASITKPGAEFENNFDGTGNDVYEDFVAVKPPPEFPTDPKSISEALITRREESMIEKVKLSSMVVNSSPPPFLLPTSDKEHRQTILPSKDPIAREDSLKRTIVNVDEGYKGVSSKRRRRLAIAEMIEKEEHTPKDTKEMARGFRHNFKDSLIEHQVHRESTPPVNLSHRRPTSQLGITPSSPSLHSVELRSTQRIESSVTPPTRINALPPAVKQFEMSPDLPNSEGNSSAHSLSLTSASSPEPLNALQALSKQTNKDAPSQNAVDDCSPEGDAQASTTAQLKRLPEDGHEDTMPLSIFDKFVSRYPDYQGTQKMFTWALVYIEWLDRQDKTVNDFLCDDFIRVLASDYEEYRAKTRDKPRTEVLTGWKYYNKKIHNPIYLQKVVYWEIFSESLSSLDLQEVQQYRSCFDTELPSIESNSEVSTKEATPSVALVGTLVTLSRRSSPGPDQHSPTIQPIKDLIKQEVVEDISLDENIPSKPGIINSSTPHGRERATGNWAMSESPELGSPTVFDRFNRINPTNPDGRDQSLESDAPSPPSQLPAVDIGDRDEIPKELPEIRRPPPTKRRFFETASQLQAAVSSPLQFMSGHVPSPNPHRNIDRVKNRRSLPWKGTVLSPSSPSSIQPSTRSARKSLPLGSRTLPTAITTFSPQLVSPTSNMTLRTSLNRHQAKLMSPAAIGRSSPLGQPMVSSGLASSEKQRRRLLPSEFKEKDTPSSSSRSARSVTKSGRKPKRSFQDFIKDYAPTIIKKRNSLAEGVAPETGVGNTPKKAREETTTPSTPASGISSHHVSASSNQRISNPRSGTRPVKESLEEVPTVDKSKARRAGSFQGLKSNEDSHEEPKTQAWSF